MSMNGFTIGFPIVSGIDLQLNFAVLVDSNPVLQLQLFEASLVVVLGIEILPCRYGWFFDETVFHGSRQRVAIDHILERLRFAACLDVRSRCEFQANDRLQFVDRLHARTRPITM